MEDSKMSNSAKTSALDRINAVLDDNSFVEVGSRITARNTDFNMTASETPADGVVTGYGTVEGVRMRPFWAAPSARCTRKKSRTFMPWL